MKNLFRKFIALEASSGILLFLAAILALALANSPVAGIYQNALACRVAGLSFAHWISDGLMTLFFLTVGLEIKHELKYGHLASKNQALFPIFAAVGGMLVPALIYLGLNWGTATARGWGVPVATDIAFSLGVLSLFGKKVPAALKVFLTTFAIADDLGAVLIIALFYTASLFWIYLGVGSLLLTFLFFLSRRKVLSLAVYLPLSIAIWICFLRSGIHATIAGVLIAFVTSEKLGKRLRSGLLPWTSFLILPLFALANAGVSLRSVSIADPLTLGTAVGLVLGKPLGILLATVLAVQLRFAAKPAGLSWPQLTGAAILGGIGFTMSIFIAGLAFTDAAHLDSARAGVLLASAISAILAACVFGLPITKGVTQ